ncbi:hypothetical protein ABNQ39_31165 [Azospirillum sp. A26]
MSGSSPAILDPRCARPLRRADSVQQGTGAFGRIVNTTKIVNTAKNA